MINKIKINLQQSITKALILSKMSKLEDYKDSDDFYKNVLIVVHCKHKAILDTILPQISVFLEPMYTYLIDEDSIIITKRLI